MYHIRLKEHENQENRNRYENQESLKDVNQKTIFI